MEQKKRVTFRHKDETKCPVCGHQFHREEMLSGGGRLIAGKLTDELRRLYEESKKYGRIYPLVYQLTVCPSCLFAAYPKDFPSINESEKQKLYGSTSARKSAVKKFFGNLDFEQDRDIYLGAASYLLAVDCYTMRDKMVAPTFKMALSSIRAAWLFSDLSKMHPDRPYKKLALFFYKKAYKYYLSVLDLIQNGNEPAEAAGNMGPDTDRNWGYEGILYMTAILTMKIGAREPDINTRIENFEKCKTYLSRLFGMGKSSKSRPSELLDMTRDLYERINSKLEEWQGTSQEE